VIGEILISIERTRCGEGFVGVAYMPGQSVQADMDVRYPEGVVAGRVDRVAWAELVQDLLRSVPGGKKAAMARTVGVDVKTVNRWIACEVDVSEESVRSVAAAFGRPLLPLLVRVGYYAPEEVSAGCAAPPEAAVDEEMELIRSAAIDPEMKIKFLARLRERREEDQRRRMADLRWMIDNVRVE
jgi:hypothetical protein